MSKELQPNEKLNRIAQRVIDSIGKQYMTQLMEKDGRIRSLHQQHAKAIADKQFFKARIIDTQLVNRTRELQAEEAGRRIHAMCENGEIDGYLDKEDHDKIESSNGQLHILIDALDSVFNDLLAVYDSCGFAPDELYMQREVRKMRKVIDKWFRGCNVYNSVFEETTRAEGDKVYDFARERQAVMFRKLDRIEKKCQTSQKKKLE